jgi:hypothetical protein
MPSIPPALIRNLEAVFVERRPYGSAENTYTLEPQSANDIRSRLFDMAVCDESRKHSAWSILAQIESWRIEYGRPLRTSTSQYRFWHFMAVNKSTSKHIVGNKIAEVFSRRTVHRFSIFSPGRARWSPTARVQRGSSETARCTSTGDHLVCPLSLQARSFSPGMGAE